MEVAEAAAKKEEKYKKKKNKKIDKKQKRPCSKKESISPSLTRQDIKERRKRAYKNGPKIRTRRGRERGRNGSSVKHNEG